MKGFVTKAFVKRWPASTRAVYGLETRRGTGCFCVNLIKGILAILIEGVSSCYGFSPVAKDECGLLCHIKLWIWQDKNQHFQHYICSITFLLQMYILWKFSVSERERTIWPLASHRAWKILYLHTRNCKTPFSTNGAFRTPQWNVPLTLRILLLNIAQL